MRKLLYVSALALVLAACGGERIKPDGDGSTDSTVSGVDGSDSGATAGGIDGGSGIGGTAIDGGVAGSKLVSYEKGAIDDPNNVLSEKIVYFAFDSNTVGDDYVELVKHHGKYLSFNTSASVRLEGHADERGSREYNIALAERRAEAVKQLMLYEGASADQISIISFGEEKPVAFGRDEESMSLNRRVEIVYQ